MPRAAFKPVDFSSDTPFAEMPTLALERLANALSKHGELLYERMFDLHLSECRVLGVVSSREPTSLGEVCEQLELDKGYVSRLVTKLVAAGLLDRSVASRDQRSAYLVLTPAGRELALKVRSAAATRNRDWMASLDAGEAAAFLVALGKMTERARSMLDVETTLACSPDADVSAAGPAREGAARTPRSAGEAAAGAARPMLVDRPVLEAMRRQLDHLLDGRDTTA